jgi:hypothetical protein
MFLIKAEQPYPALSPSRGKERIAAGRPVARIGCKWGVILSGSEGSAFSDLVTKADSSAEFILSMTKGLRMTRRYVA